jgi:hypothetical protein
LFIGALDSCGFTPAQIRGHLSIVKLLQPSLDRGYAARTQKPPPVDQATRAVAAPSWFAGSGQSLRARYDNMHVQTVKTDLKKHFGTDRGNLCASVASDTTTD